MSLGDCVIINYEHASGDCLIINFEQASGGDSDVDAVNVKVSLHWLPAWMPTTSSPNTDKAEFSLALYVSAY